MKGRTEKGKQGSTLILSGEFPVSGQNLRMNVFISFLFSRGQNSSNAVC